MPIQSLEWLFITIIVIVLVLWDPQKIPKLARALAQARKEYEKAASTVQEVVEEAKKEIEEQDIDDKIIEAARELGIETYGRTREEILDAIAKIKAEEQTSVTKPENSAEAQKPSSESSSQNS